MRYLNMNQLREKRGQCGRNAVYKGIADGTLPQPLKIAGKNYWVEAEIDELMQRELETRKTGPLDHGPQSNQPETQVAA